MKYINPKKWIAQAFRAKAVRNGGIIRRKRSNIEKFAGLNAWMEEVEKRGFHCLEVGDQIVVLCNSGRMKVLA